MYSTCLSCYRRLGSNDLLTRLPVGRLVAFDADRGRLWVVCEACRFWNLVPLETRWEAVEEAADRFGATRRRAVADAISLAFIDDRMGLIRIGGASLPEFAAWRYGTELFGRSKRLWRGAQAELAGVGIGAGGALGAAGTVAALGAAPLVVAGAVVIGIPAGLYGWSHFAQRRSERPLLWMFGADGAPQSIPVMAGATADLVPDPEHGWAVSIHDHAGRRDYRGYSAWRVLAAILAHQNRFGARRRSIEAAVGHIEEAGESHNFPAGLVRSDRVPIMRLPPTQRLALEISLHETSERRALDGDLAELERQWQDAEEIARIADDLLVPDAVSRRLAGLRGTAAHGANGSAQS